MDRGGMTRRRIYLWMAAVLATVLLIVVLYGVFFLPHPEPIQSTADTTDTTAFTYEHHTFKQHQSRRTQRHYRPHYGHNAQPAYQPQSRPDDRQYRSKFLLVELNSADSIDLVQLHNIGPTFARRILRYRNLLGGFVDKSQLWEVYGMDSTRFNDIAPHVTIDNKTVAQLDLNSATLDQLKRHPYLDYQQARAIIRHRDAMGPYHSIHDLAQVALLDSTTICKLTPYLTCNSLQNK